MRYVNMSNLNAEYDGQAIQGLGALGADPSDDYYDYPWLMYSRSTEELQAWANPGLRANGYCPITVNGILDAKTCGALNALGQFVPETCAGYEDPALCPNDGGSTVPASSYPWNSYSSATLALQKQINVLLAAQGYCTIGEDGKLGAKTCGAAYTVGVEIPSTCQSMTMPEKCGPLPPPDSYDTTAYPWGASSAQTLALQKAINGGLLSNWNGSCPIPESGILDAKTCGAATFTGEYVPTTCEVLTAYTHGPCGGGVTPPGPGPGPGPEPTPEPPIAQASSVNWTVLGLVAAGVLVGGAILLKKKKRAA